jgi:uncharacterized repeat protein (TIGR04076 family)
MSTEMPECRITVLKKTISQDLIDEYLEEEYRNIGPCEKLEVGQEFIVKDYSTIPEGFCVSAWVDIFKDLMLVATGGSMPGLRRKGTVIVGCSDWFRPVVFKLERLTPDTSNTEEVKSK